MKQLVSMKELLKLYENLLEDNKSMITIVDAETFEIIYANQNAIQHANCDGDYIGSICYKSIQNSDVPCKNCMLTDATKGPYNTEDLEYAGRNYRMVKKLIELDTRKVLMEVSEDVTEEYQTKKMKVALDQESQKEAIFLNALPGGVATYHIMKDGTIKCSYISERLAKLIGYTAQEFLDIYGEDARAAVVTEDLTIIQKELTQLIAEGTPVNTHYRLKAKNGGVVTISFQGNIIDLGEKLPGEIMTIYGVEMLANEETIMFLKRQEERERIFENLPGGIGLYDIYNGEAKLIFLNNAYYKIIGLSRHKREAYFGHNILQVVHPEDKHFVQDLVDNVCAGIPKGNATFRVENDAGVWKWIHLELFSIKEDNGHYTGYGNLSDYDTVVNSRLVMEAARKKEEALINSIPGGTAIYRLKKNNTVTTDFLSDNLAIVGGYTSEEFWKASKDNGLRYVDSEDISIINAAVQKSLHEHTPINTRYHLVAKDGSTVLMRLDANMIESDSLGEDDIAMIYAVHTVVTDEARRVIEEQKFMSTLLNTVPAGIGVFEIIDGELSQKYMNDAFFRILNVTREEREVFTGKNALLAIHPEDRPGIQKAVKALMDGATNVHVDYRLSNSDGEWRWFHVNGSVSERKENYIQLYTVFFDCTESKEQELNLLRNQRAVELAQRQGNLNIWSYNIDQKTIVQEVFSDDDGFMGYGKVIHNVPDFFIETQAVHPDDCSMFLDTYKQLYDGAEKVEITYRLMNHQTKDYDWISMYYQRIENNDSVDRIAVGFSMNANKQQEAIEQYKVEKDMREQMNINAKFYIEYNLTQGTYQHSSRTIGSYDKKEWEHVSDFEYKDKISQTVEDAYLQNVSDTLYFKNLLSAFAAGEKKVSCEFRSKARPGRPSTWHRTTVAMVKRPDTGDVMAFIYVEDIEEEKVKKLALENSLSDGIESIAVIHLADSQARLIKTDSSNSHRNLEEYFTYNDDFVWRSHRIVLENDRDFSYQAALLSTIEAELKTKEVYQYSVSTKLKNGKIKRQNFRFRYLDDRKTDILMSISDITTLYMEEQEKNDALKNALSESKRASMAKADFYSRMSHDMRTPMNGIMGMTELSEGERSSEALQENMKKIHESGEYLLSLINDTLDIQRIESGKMVLEPQIVNIKETIENIMDMVRNNAKTKGVNLRFSSNPIDLDWYIRIDALRFKQIFINLLSNAVKFTPEGGDVRLEFTQLGQDGNIGHDVIVVRDTGLGMSKSFLENRIFKPFSQESNAVSTQYAGSGLGLSIAKSLVELMGGQILVESQLGEGTTFTIKLDIERVSGDEAKLILENEKVHHQDVTVLLKDKKILLVEDHPLNAEIARKLLERVGCQITWVQNGKLAVDTIAQSQANAFDAVLMDIRMPVMDGLEATRQIRKLDQPWIECLPIIAMTANAYEDDINKSIEAGMNAHIGKPIEPKKMYEIIAEHL